MQKSSLLFYIQNFGQSFPPANIDNDYTLYTVTLPCSASFAQYSEGPESLSLMSNKYLLIVLIQNFEDFFL